MKSTSGYTTAGMIFNLFIRPRKTMYRILNRGEAKHLNINSMAFGMISMFQILSYRNAGNNYSILESLLCIIFLGTIIGVIYISLLSWIVSVVGKGVNGVVSSGAIRTLLIWTKFPYLIILPVQIIFLFNFGETYLTRNFSPDGYSSDGMILLYGAVSVASFILWIWSIVVFILALSEIQKFGILKTIISVLVSYVFLMIIMVFFAASVLVVKVLFKIVTDILPDIF